MALSRPRKLTAEDAIEAFDSGDRLVNEWLQQRAHRNQASGATTVYVVRDLSRIVGFYALSASAVERTRVQPGKLKRNLPDPIPVLLLGQLGVDRAYQGNGIGGALIQDAFIRALAVAQRVGIAALLVEARTADLVPFYRRFGFDSISPLEPTVMMVRIKDIAASVM